MRESVIYQQILAEGREEAQQNIALNVLARKFAPQEMAELTSLLVEQVQDLQTKSTTSSERN